MCMNDLPKVAARNAVAGSQTRELLVTNPVPNHYATKTAINAV